jgi:UDP-glucuronate decarboxylase
VVGLDNFASGQYRHIKELEKNTMFEFHIADIRTPIHFMNNDFDEIYNLACPASPIFYQRMPLFTLETSTQ